MEKRVHDPRKCSNAVILTLESPGEREKIQMLWPHRRDSGSYVWGGAYNLHLYKHPGDGHDDASKRSLFEGHCSNASWPNPSAMA